MSKLLYTHLSYLWNEEFLVLILFLSQSMFLVPFCSFFHPSNDCLFSQKNQIKKKKKKEEGKKVVFITTQSSNPLSSKMIFEDLICLTVYQTVEGSGATLVFNSGKTLCGIGLKVEMPWNSCLVIWATCEADASCLVVCLFLIFINMLKCLKDLLALHFTLTIAHKYFQHFIIVICMVLFVVLDLWF